jgi:hypothetical protein
MRRPLEAAPSGSSTPRSPANHPQSGLVDCRPIDGGGTLVDRRTFLGGLTSGLLATPLAAEAQPAGKVYRIVAISEVMPPNARGHSTTACASLAGFTDRTSSSHRPCSRSGRRGDVIGCRHLPRLREHRLAAPAAGDTHHPDSYGLRGRSRAGRPRGQPRQTYGAQQHVGATSLGSRPSYPRRAARAWLSSRRRSQVSLGPPFS